MRWLLRMPIWLYRLRLGWLLGERFVMFTHIGRKTGLPRQTVVEVVLHDQTIDTYIIAAGWGDRADWFRNIQQTPRVLLDTGRRRFEANATRLSTDAAAGVLRTYAQRHPLAFRALTRLIDGQHVHSSADYDRLARVVPPVALQPRNTATQHTNNDL